MNARTIAAVALIVLGVFGLAYGGLTSTKNRHEIGMGPMSVTTSEHRTIPVPLWAGVAAILLGTGLLVVAARKR